MNSQDITRYEMFQRVIAFRDARTPQFPADSKAAQEFAIVGTALADIDDAEGGNALAVAEPRHKPTKLHAFWGDVLVEGASYAFLDTLADGVGAGTSYDPVKMKKYKKNKSFESWAGESLDDAEAFAYLEGQLEFADWNDYDDKKITAADVPVLKSTYVNNANDMARRLVALGGKRLADVLKKLF